MKEHSEPSKEEIKELKALLKEIHDYDYQHLLKYKESALSASLSDKIIKKLNEKEA